MFEPEEARRLISKIMNLDTPPWRPMPSRKIAALLGVSLQTLANWRVRSSGPEPAPRPRGKGNRTFYVPAGVASWLAGIAGEPLEAWKVTMGWLKEKKCLELYNPSEEAFAEATTFLDEQRLI